MEASALTMRLTATCRLGRNPLVQARDHDPTDISERPRTHGKEGVVGSSPTEGSPGSPVSARFLRCGRAARVRSGHPMEALWKPRGSAHPPRAPAARRGGPRPPMTSPRRLSRDAKRSRPDELTAAFFATRRSLPPPQSRLPLIKREGLRGPHRSSDIDVRLSLPLVGSRGVSMRTDA
jgi:hypothetical protein